MAIIRPVNRIRLPAITVSGSEVSAPLWFQNASASTWFDIPGTSTGTIAAVFAGAGDAGVVVYPWCGFAFDTANLRIQGVGNGGHGDYAGNEAYELDLNAASSCAWARLTDPSAAADATQASNSDGALGDGSKAADHTYGIVQYAEGKVWFPAFGAMAGATGYPSSAVWSWDRTQIGTRNGYTYHGKATTAVGAGHPGLVESYSCYDSTNRRIWYIPEESSTGDTATFWSVHCQTASITTYTTGLGVLIPCFVVYLPQFNHLLIGAESGLFRLDCSNPNAGLTSCTESGTPARSVRSTTGVYHSVSNKVLVWVPGSANLRTLSIPASVSGMYAWGTQTISGTAPTEPTNGIWKKWGIFPDMGNGEALLALVHSEATAVKAIKIPLAGY